MSSFISFFRILSLISQRFTLPPLPLRIVAPLPLCRCHWRQVGSEPWRSLAPGDWIWSTASSARPGRVGERKTLGMGACHGMNHGMNHGIMAWIMAVSKVNAMLCLKVKIDLKVIHGVLGVFVGRSWACQFCKQLMREFQCFYHLRSFFPRDRKLLLLSGAVHSKLVQIWVHSSLLTTWPLGTAATAGCVWKRRNALSKRLPPRTSERSLRPWIHGRYRHHWIQWSTRHMKLGRFGRKDRWWLGKQMTVRAEMVWALASKPVEAHHRQP